MIDQVEYLWKVREDHRPDVTKSASPLKQGMTQINQIIVRCRYATHIAKLINVHVGFYILNNPFNAQTFCYFGEDISQRNRPQR